MTRNEGHMKRAKKKKKPNLSASQHAQITPLTALLKELVLRVYVPTKPQD